MSRAHLELGVASPFLVSPLPVVYEEYSGLTRGFCGQWTPRPHTHPSLASIRKMLHDVVGAQIATDGTPKTLGPLVIGVTG